jgi:HAD superfamily hydrolase (TIGR01509 family)
MDATQQPTSGGPGASLPYAVVFDVDGTLADTERHGHRPAFNQAFADHGLDHEWDEATYGELIAVTGGRRRIEGFLAADGHPDPAEAARVLHLAKTENFLEWVRNGPVVCRPGVDALIKNLRDRGVAVGVATTGRRAWVLPLLDRLFGLDTFATIVTGDDVENLKPAPDAYHLAVQRLGLQASRVLAIEDSPPGLAAARAAGLACIVVVNDYTREGTFDGAALLLDDFDGLDARGCEAALSGSRDPA